MVTISRDKPRKDASPSNDRLLDVVRLLGRAAAREAHANSRSASIKVAEPEEIDHE